MAEERPLTPEKQLLDLIEGSRTKGARIQANAIKRRSLSFFSAGAWIGRSTFFKDRFKGWLKAKRWRTFDVKAVNDILAFIIFILAAYFISNFFISAIRLKKIPDYLKLEAQNDKTESADAYETSGLGKAASYYLEKVRQRDIFKMGPKATPEDSVKAPSSKIVEATQHLKLVGISWSNDPDAMIEDTKAMRTFFIKRGQMMGEIKVQAIFKDKVVLSYGGEEIELK